MRDDISAKLSKYQLPKSDQQKEIEEIERIFREEYGFKARVLIFGEDLTRFGVAEIIYDNLLIGIPSYLTGKIQNIEFNGQFKKLGVESVFYVSLDSGEDKNLNL